MTNPRSTPMPATRVKVGDILEEGGEITDVRRVAAHTAVKITTADGSSRICGLDHRVRVQKIAPRTRR